MLPIITFTSNNVSLNVQFRLIANSLIKLIRVLTVPPIALIAQVTTFVWDVLSDTICMFQQLKFTAPIRVQWLLIFLTIGVCLVVRDVLNATTQLTVRRVKPVTFCL